MKELINNDDLSIEPSAEGLVTIQLFEEGKLVREEKRKNYIHPNWINAYKRLLGYSIISGNTVRFPRNSTGTGSPVAGTIILTDDGRAVSQNTHIDIAGKEVARATINRTGETSSKWGNFNPSESEYNHPTYKKLVFDFATNQANGTWQSLYTVTQIGPTDAQNGTAIPTSLFNMSSTTDSNLFKKLSVVVNGVIYSANGTTIYKFPLANNIADGWFNINQVSSASLPKGINDITAKGNDIYVLCSGGMIYKCTNGDILNPEFVKTLTKTDIGWTYGNQNETPNLYTLCWDSVHNQWYTVVHKTTGSVGSTANSYYEFVALGNDFTIKHSMIYTSTSEYNNDLSLNLSTYNHLVQDKCDPSIFYFYDNRVLKVTSPSTIKYMYPVSYGTNGISVIPISKTYLAYIYSYTTYFMPNTHFMTRIRLDSPVTKQENQTMKITYEFTSPDINWTT